MKGRAVACRAASACYVPASTARAAYFAPGFDSRDHRSLGDFLPPSPASVIRFMIVTPLDRPPRRRSRCAAVDVTITQVNFVRHDPSLTRSFQGG